MQGGLHHLEMVVIYSLQALYCKKKCGGTYVYVPSNKCFLWIKLDVVYANGHRASAGFYPPLFTCKLALWIQDAFRYNLLDMQFTSLLLSSTSLNFRAKNCLDYPILIELFLSQDVTDKNQNCKPLIWGSRIKIFNLNFWTKWNICLSVQY